MTRDDERLALTVTVASTPRSRLQSSLVRLDAAARARVVSAGTDVEHIVAQAAARLEERAVTALREGLHSRAWLAIGVAVGIGILLGRRR